MLLWQNYSSLFQLDNTVTLTAMIRLSIQYMLGPLFKLRLSEHEYMDIHSYLGVHDMGEFYLTIETSIKSLI